MSKGRFLLVKEGGKVKAPPRSLGGWGPVPVTPGQSGRGEATTGEIGQRCGSVTWLEAKQHNCREAMRLRPKPLTVSADHRPRYSTTQWRGQEAGLNIRYSWSLLGRASSWTHQPGRTSSVPLGLWASIFLCPTVWLSSNPKTKLEAPARKLSSKM